MLIFDNDSVTGLIAPITAEELTLEPLLHESGAAHYIIDNATGEMIVDASGAIWFLRRRTDAELQATPEYQAWLAAHPAELPAIYLTLAISGGDGKTPIVGANLGHATQGTLDFLGDLRLSPDTPGLPFNINFAWRITLRKVISEFNATAIDSVPVDGCEIINNVIEWRGFDPAAVGLTAGIYAISDADFATLSGAAFGLSSDVRVALVGGNKFFKVLK